MQNDDQPIINNSLPPITPQKTNAKKLLLAGTILVVILIIGVILFLWPNKSETNKAATTNTATTSAPVIPAPLVTTAAPAALKPGTYMVGPNKAIVPGLYALSPGAQQNGTFTVVSQAASYSVALNDSATGAGYDTRLAWAQLADGDEVKIDGGNLMAVNFKAVATSPSTPPALAKLYDNTVLVTDTPNRVNPGRYFITDSNDKNAFMLVIDKNNTIKYNEPLNGSGFHVNLEVGDQIATINMTSYKMKPE